MLVGELCIRDVVVANRHAPIVEIAQLMRDYHVGDIVIVDGEEGSARTPLGIVTDRDIVLELIAKAVPLDSVCAGDIMGPDLTTVTENTGVWDALQLMRGKGVRRLPVVDDKGALAGIVSADDLLEILADQLQDLAILIGKEQRRERQLRQ